MSIPADYTTITSKDGEIFTLESKLLPPKFSTTLPYSAKIVEKIIEYIHYKYMYQSVQHKKLPAFSIAPEEALDVLRASIELGI